MIYNILDYRKNREETGNKLSPWVFGVLEPSHHDNNNVNELMLPIDSNWIIKEYRYITVSMLFQIANKIPGLVTVYLYDIDLDS